jgi:hypothetical protein
MIYFHYLHVTSLVLWGYSPIEGAWKDPYYNLIPTIAITSCLLLVTTSASLLPIVDQGRD